MQNMIKVYRPSCEPAHQIVNMYTSWIWQLAGTLNILGMRTIGELRGRSDLLVYITN
jgi:glutamate synthase domain-containing protein 2